LTKTDSDPTPPTHKHSFPTTNVDAEPAALRDALVHIEDVRKFCAAALCRLSWRKDGYVAQMVREGAVEAALDLAQTTDKGARWNCATVLCNIAFHRPTQLQMVTDHAVAALTTLAQCGDSEVQQLCAIALFQLSTNAACHLHFAKDGGVVALTGFLRDALDGHGPPELALLSITALYNLSCSQSADSSDQCARAIIEAFFADGTFAAIARLLSSAVPEQKPNSGAIIVLFARLMANMSSAYDIREAMISSGTVAVLVQVVHACELLGGAAAASAARQQIEASVCVALCNLSFGTSLLAVALQEGLLDVVHLLLQSCEESVAEGEDGTSSEGELAAIGSRCSIILRNVSCDHVAAPIAVERSDLMPMFSLLVTRAQKLTRAETIEGAGKEAMVRACVHLLFRGLLIPLTLSCWSACCGCAGRACSRCDRQLCPSLRHEETAQLCPDADCPV